MNAKEAARLLPDANPNLVLQTVVRAFRVLEAVNAADQPMSLADIANATASTAAQHNGCPIR